MKHFAKWSWNRVRALFLALVLLFGMLTLNGTPPPSTPSPQRVRNTNWLPA